MDFLKKLAPLFWRKSEHRLRTTWRLTLYLMMFLGISAAVLFSLSFWISVVHLLQGRRPFVVLSDAVSLFGLHTSYSWIQEIIIPLSLGVSAVLTTLLAARWLDKRPFFDFGLHFNKRWWGDLGFGLGLGALLVLLVFVVGLLTKTIQVVGFWWDFWTWHLLSFEGWFFISSLKVFLTVICEALIFHGYFLVNMSEGLGKNGRRKKKAIIISWLISSVLFGLIQFLTSQAFLFDIVNLVILGLFLGLGMVLTGEMGISIGLHLAWALFRDTIFGFPVHRIKVTLTIIEIRLGSRALFMGEEFGPEKGLLGLAVMLVGSGLIVWWVWRRKKTLGWAEALADYRPPVSVLEGG